VFRYEIRRCRNGVIADLASATGSPVPVSADSEVAQRLLDLARSVPTPVWGRGELRVGEMWNSNSVSSWLLPRGGIATQDLRPPHNGPPPAGTRAERSPDGSSRRRSSKRSWANERRPVVAEAFAERFIPAPLAACRTIADHNNGPAA
jgi:hypothetical protein